MKQCEDCKRKKVRYISNLGFGNMVSKCRLAPSKTCNHYKRKWWKFWRV